MISRCRRLTFYLDSSVSKRNAASVVTSSAYLLLYRRRSSDYLGPAKIQKIVADYRHGDEAEEISDSEATSSRAGSPSGQGKGQRLGGSFQNGSATTSVAAGADRPHRRGGDGLEGSQVAQGGLLRNGMGGDGYDAEDEGVSMEGEDVDNALPFGPQLPPTNQSWSFASLGPTGANSDAENDTGDVDSNMANGGDDDSGAGQELQSRMMEDFGDEADDTFNPGHNNSPIFQSTEYLEDMEDVVPGLTGIEHYANLPDEDEQVVDIHIDDEEMPELEESRHMKDD